MKLAPLALAALMSLGALSAAMADTKFASTEDCLSALGVLDKNGDGYIDSAERAQYTNLESDADTDGDGRISNAEQTAACRSGALTELKRKN